jgi:Glycosyl hydrolases family 28
MTDQRVPLALSRRDLLLRGSAVLLVPAARAAQQATAVTAFDVRGFGATGQRADNATSAFQRAIDACTAAGGGTVRVPSGAYTIGMIELKDNVTLDLDAGATLLLSQDTTQFPRGRRAMVFAENAHNIAVTGRGTLDGLAQYVFTEMRGVDPEIADEIAIAQAAGVDMRRYYRTGVQTYMFILNGCHDVLLRDISIVHSPLWNVRLNDCDRVQVRGVYIYSDLEKGVNADGIDIVSSRNVIISDSVIETADDAIVLKTIARDGRPAQPTENVTVTNCVLTSSSTPLMIGTETEADIRHVLFTNCVIRNANKGFGINVQDGASVSDVIYRGLTIETSRRHWNWWGSAEMCKFVLKKRTPASRLGAIRDIAVADVIAHARGTSTIVGHAEQPIENLRMTGVELHMLPENALDKRATDAMRFVDVRDLRLRDLSIRWADDAPEPKWSSAIVLQRTSAFTIDSFSGRQGRVPGDAAAIVLDDAVEGAIASARGSVGCRRLIHVQGDATRELTVRDSRVPAGGTLVTYAHDRLRRSPRLLGVRSCISTFDVEIQDLTPTAPS